MAKQESSRAKRFPEILFASAVALVLLAGCVAQPHRAWVRNEAGYRLRSCLRMAERPSPSEPARRACLEEMGAYCESEGLERTCGLGDAWTAD